ncbi:MAG: hypothetical protein Q6354_04085 [Candidatus Brocadiales bacterium]|nr:hypothetical protein [Candidatus Brocadiales bacterium]
MDEKYKELVRAIDEYRGSDLRLLEGIEDHSLKLNDTNTKEEVRALVKELHKVTIPHSSAIDKLDKITDSVNAPPFRHDLSNFTPPYPSRVSLCLGDTQERRQEEYKLRKKGKFLEYIIAQEQNYLEKYGQLFKGEATGTGRDERQKRNIITIKIEKSDVGLTQTEALCLMALKEELKNRTKYIRPVYITIRVWPDETLKGKNRLKYYWSNLRKKLDAKVKLPGFEHFRSKHEGYCLGTKNTPWKPPSWVKNIRFPKSLRLPPAVKSNR